MPSSRDLSDFKDLISDEIDVSVSKNILETAVQWIADNMSPDAVFDDQALRESVAKFSLPEDVFGEKELSEWAESNGYTKEA